jgi:hypothetical protein
MDFQTLTRFIGAIRRTLPSHRIIIFGSSSLLASFPNDDPAQIGVLATLDADFFLDPEDAEMRRRLEAEFGEDNAYHAATGHYGDFVDLRLADAFPKDWRQRLVPVLGCENVFGIDPVDMAVTKVAATARSRLSRRLGGEMPDRGLKDINTIVALLKTGRIARDEFQRRYDTMDYAPALIVESSNVIQEILRMVDAA